MPAPLSVIILLDGEATALPALADALLEGVGCGLIAEMILCPCGDAGAGLAELAEGLGARLLPCASGPGGAMARGLAVARADWALCLLPEALPAPGWPAVVLAHLNRPGRAAGYVPGPAPRGGAGLFGLRRAPLAQGLLLPCAPAAGRALPGLPCRADAALVRALGLPLAPLGIASARG